MMKKLLYIAHLFDNKKDRSYVSEAGKFLKEFDENNPQKSESQKNEILKHRNIFKRTKKTTSSFLDGE